MELKVTYTAKFETRADFVLAQEETLNEVGTRSNGEKGDMSTASTSPQTCVYTFIRT